MKDGHKSCNLSSVVYMVWRVPRRRNDGSTIICSNPYRNKRTADQIMHKCNALCSELQGTVGEHQIMVYQGRSMRYLDKKDPRLHYCMLFHSL